MARESGSGDMGTIVSANGFNDWEHLLQSPPPPSPSTLPPPPITNATTTTSHNISDDLLSIFPPINHEGLSIHSSPNDSRPNRPDLRAIADEASLFPPVLSDSDLDEPSNCRGPHSPPSCDLPVTRWSSFALRILNSKLVSFFSSLRIWVLAFRRKYFVSGCGGMITAALLAVFGMWLLWRRRRRGRGGGVVDDSVEHLKLLIKEKDEKIIELLNQTAQLNELLFARYTVPVVKATIKND